MILKSITQHRFLQLVACWLFVLATILLSGPRAEALVINEIMYHDVDLDDKPFEWIEIYNERLDPFDMSNFSICDGVDFVFPEDTWLDGYSYIIIASDPAAFASKYDTTDMTVLGPWTGSLSNSGEDIEICNVGGLRVARVDYDDAGKWLASADGAGHSLSLISPYTDTDDADSWTQSIEMGGTPGEWNNHTDSIGSGPPVVSGSQPGMDGQGFILNWLMLGPYNTGLACNIGNNNIQRDYLRGTSTPREDDLIWRDEQVVNTNFTLAASTGLHSAGGGTPEVFLYESFSNTINLNDNVWGAVNPENVMSYSFAYIDNITGSPLPVTIGCASDDAISVLLNGNVVHTNDACRGVGNEGQIQDRFNTTLQEGKNLIAVKVFENGGGWSFRLRIEERGNGNPISSPCTIQLSNDVDEGLDFNGNGDPVIDPAGEDCDGGGGPDPDPGGDSEGAHFAPVVINETHFRTAGSRWVELFNRTSSPIDLSGYHMTDDPINLAKATLPGGSTIPGNGYLTFTDVELGLDFEITETNGRIYVALTNPDETQVLDASNFKPDYDEMSIARIPDGDDEFEDASNPTHLAPNSITLEDSIIINEIMYHTLDGNEDKEYVELYNRGNSTVNISNWKLSTGLDFTIPDGTTMAADSYLVIARNPELIRQIYSLNANQVIGPETPEALDDFGVLRNSGERISLKDHFRRTVDTVRFHDGREWSRWPDGLGSSLELIDPFQDNRFGGSWDASDDSHKAEATEFSYIGQHGGGESELHLALMSRGITVVDDVSIIGGGVSNDDTDLVSRGSTWRYRKGTSAPPAGWNEHGFNDSSWSQGATSIGYGDNDDATILNDMEDNYMTVYCRRTFNVTNPNEIDNLILSTIIDDGYIAYINGEEVNSYNVSGSNFDDRAQNAIGDGDLIERDISSFKHLLVAGSNTIAIQVHNAGLGSSDLTFDPALISRVTTIVGGSEQLTNGTFESNTTGWMIEGTHIRSGRTTTDPITGNGSLKIIASGRGDNKVNRIETPNGNVGLNSLTTGEDLQISLKARWVIGSQTILTHGFEHAMAKSHSLAVPENLGTPGEINSVTQRQLDRNGGNLGPVMKDVVQIPAVPRVGDDVTIRIRVSDADGIQNNSVRLRWSVNNPSSSPNNVTMTSIGDDWYEGTIPSQSNGTKVVFYITATDTNSVSARYPVDVMERTHPLVLNPSSASIHDERHLIYRVIDSDPATQFHQYRFWMSNQMESTVNSRRRLSNDLVPGSLLFGAEKIYHEAHGRFSGSPFARGGWGGSWRIAMPRGNLLHETIRKFNLEDHHGNGSNARERVSHYLIRNQNGGGVPVPYSDLVIMVRWQVNDRASGTREHVWVPDVQFISQWFPKDDDGSFFEIDDRFVINDSGNRQGNTNARVLYPPPSSRDDGNGENKENYRWFFGLRSENGADNFTEMINFAEVMDPGVTGNSEYDDIIWDIVNVEEMLRIWAVRWNTDDWDTWGANRGKNAYLYHPAIDSRWNLLAWDCELTYGGTGGFNIPTSPSSNFSPGGFSEVNRFANRPHIKRVYYGILKEMLIGPDAWFGSDYLSGYMTKLQALGMSNTGIGQPGGFIDQRANIVRPRLTGAIYPQVQFTITTNSGNNFSVDSLQTTLNGGCPAEVQTVIISNNGGAPFEANVEFTGMNTWRITDLPLVPGANSLDILGYDLRDNLVDSDSITITSTVTEWDPPTIVSITPSEGLPGDTVTITGTEFHNGLVVEFDGVPLDSNDVTFDEFGPNPDEIEIELPDGLGQVQVVVRNLDGKASNAFAFTLSEPPPTFIRGDVNRDLRVDLGDAITGLLHTYRGLAITCEEAADVNDDGALDNTDPIYLLNFLYLNGAAPPAPFPSAGEDLDADAHTCEA